jgi:hypothetical protein
MLTTIRQVEGKQNKQITLETLCGLFPICREHKHQIRYWSWKLDLEFGGEKQ